MKTKKLGVAMFSALALCSVNFSAHAAQWDISITNLTHQNLFTPLLAAGHDSTTHLFELGATASTGVALMAECGDLSTLLAEATTANADISDIASGMLAAGATTTGMITTDKTHLSVAAMILPSNDAFMGLDAKMIPTAAGTYTFYLDGYDAGTEANNELQHDVSVVDCAANIAGFPGGSSDVGGSNSIAVDDNMTIHIHRGLLGDTDPLGGTSDVDSRIHRWQNPVAKVVVTVTP